jgi:hypothetical protein
MSKIAWDLKNRGAMASIQPQQQQQILRSLVWLDVVGKPLMWVVERGIDLERVGCLYGTGDVVLPDLFVCLVARVLQILPKPEIVLAFVRQDVHKYLRMLGAAVIRLIGNQLMLSTTLAICLEDFRNIRVRSQDGALRIEPLDRLCEALYFGFADDGHNDASSGGAMATSVDGDREGVAANRLSLDWLGLRLSRLMHPIHLDVSPSML